MKSRILKPNEFAPDFLTAGPVNRLIQIWHTVLISTSMSTGMALLPTIVALEILIMKYPQIITIIRILYLWEYSRNIER